MKYIITICLAACSTIFCGWHSWDNPPDDGQLYMTYNMYAKNKIIFVVTHYNKYHPIYQYKEQGWYDIQPQDILNWINDGSKILYLPSPVDNQFLDKMQILLN